MKTAAGRILTATAALWLLTFFYCNHRFWRDPNSVFFDSSAVYEQSYARIRGQEALDFLATSMPNVYTSSPDPMVCAALATTKRNSVRYLNKTVGSMLAGLATGERSALNARLFFVDIELSAHPHYHQRWLRQLDYAAGFNLSKDTTEYLRTLEETKDLNAKGVFDYACVLLQCLEQTNAPYIAIFGDDIIFTDGWLSKTLEGLTELQAQPRSWLYLRLFYFESSLYRRQTKDFWTGYLSLTSVLLCCLLASCLFLLRWSCRPLRTVLTISTVVVLCSITLPAFTVLYFMISKYDVHSLPELERDESRCCTQALIFPRAQVLPLVTHLQDRPAGQIDSIIGEYADETGLQRFVLAPKILQHIRTTPSHDGISFDNKDPQPFWFETDSAIQLRKDHEALINRRTL